VRARGPFAEVGIERRIDRFSAEGWLLAKAALYRDPYGYQAGNQILGGLRVASDLWTPRWRFLLGVVAYREEAERWSGVIETEGNLGRTDLIVETSATWRFSDPWAITASVRAPVATWAVGGQLNTPAIAEVTISRSFDLLGSAPRPAEEPSAEGRH